MAVFRSVCLFGVVFLTCSGLFGQGKTYTVKTTDGVNYIHNIVPLWRNAQEKITFQFVQKIGASPKKDTHYTFNRPQDVTVDPQGNIYILDNGNCRIVKYTKTGKYISIIGKEGNGPCEFQLPHSIQYTKQNTITVSDEIKRYTSVLSTAGKELKRLSAENGEYFTFRILNSGDMVSYGISNFAELVEGKPFQEPMLKIFNAQVVKKAEFCKPLDTGDLFTNILMNEIRFTTDTADNIYVIFTRQNIIDKYGQTGKQLWRSERQLNYLMIIPEPPENVQALNFFNAITAATPNASTQVNQFAHTVEADSLGRAWVYTLLSQPEGIINTPDYVPAETALEIYDQNGILLAQIQHPKEIKELYTYRIFGGSIFFIDCNVENCVFEYKIIEK